jgi:dipeptidyl-peptidase-4
MRSCFFLLLLVLPARAAAQAADANMPEIPLKHTDYLRDLAQTRSFILGRPVKPQPTPDGKAVLFLRSGPRSPRLSLFEFDVAKGATRELLTPEQVLKGAEEKLSPEEKARRERMRVSAGGFTSYQLSDDGRLILLTLSGKLFLVRRETAAVEELPTGPGPLLDPRLAPDATKVAYVRGHDLYVLDLAARTETRLTHGGSAALTHGLAEFVAQEEMARFSGYWWAPDSSALAYQETDQREVEVWHVADPTYPGQTPTPFHYPRPGKANAQVRLGVIAVAGGPTTWIDWDRSKFPYLATVRWARHGPLSLTVQTRAQKEVVLLSADVTTGKTTPLLTEKSDTWVALHQEVPHWLPANRGFLWISDRDGGPRLELRSSETGRVKRVVVPVEMGLHGLAGVAEEGDEIAFTASTDPTQSHVYRLSLADPFAEAVDLTPETGLHAAVFSRAHGLYVHTARPLSFMPKSTVCKPDGTVVGVLPAVADKPPFKPNVEIVRVGPTPGFYAAVVRPRDFDPARRYPVIVDAYGGPHHLHVSASRQRWQLDQWYADQGFVVVSIDGRGTPGRGDAWEHAIYQKFDAIPLDDQISGLRALAAQYPFLDLERAGIDGWSFGGYLAAQAVLRRPDVFRAAVAGAPVTDWYDYDTHYTERYLGIPPAAAEVYRTSSLLTYAGELRRPLLLLHGTADDNVYFCHSLKLAAALFRHGKSFELVPLSGLTHMVPDPDVMEKLHGRIARFFQKHLGTPH